MARIILENDLWILVAVGLSLLELQEGYRLCKEQKWVNRQQRWKKIFLIGSYALCIVALLIIVVCNGTILAFTLIYFLNKVVRTLILRRIGI